MAEYKIFFSRSAVKDLDPIPKKDLQRIMERVRLLQKDPRSPGCEKLSSQERYRIRQGNYRIVYSVQDDQLTIHIVKIAHRSDVYC
jgi:mRNA interferase RelE/StbE